MSITTRSTQSFSNLQEPYRPYKIFIGFGLFITGLLLAIYFVWSPNIEFHKTVSAATVDQQDAKVQTSHLAVFVSRLTQDPYKIFMCYLFFITIAYAALQSWAVSSDLDWFLARLSQSNPATKTERKQTKRAGRFIFAVFTGRPQQLYTEQGEPLNYNQLQQRLEHHLLFGMPALAEPLRLSLWSFPMIGFLGTVIGLSQAIRELPAAMAASGGEKRAALAPVLDKLYLAFDTTILGIIAAIIIMLFIQLYERNWEPLQMLMENARAKR